MNKKSITQDEAKEYVELEYCSWLNREYSTRYSVDTALTKLVEVGWVFTVKPEARFSEDGRKNFDWQYIVDDRDGHGRPVGTYGVPRAIEALQNRRAKIERGEI